MKQCPKCKSGKLVVKENAFTRGQFLGCTNWPDCKFVPGKPEDMGIKERLGIYYYGKKVDFSSDWTPEKASVLIKLLEKEIAGKITDIELLLLENFPGLPPMTEEEKKARKR